MTSDYRYKMIMDPVHGDIGLSELETRIIDTPTFQRLRRLKQLGFASYVYPNASYSRFAHSLGVLHIASRVANVFHQDKFINDEAVTKLRIAALLHDIGHYPYSHLMEYVEKEQATDPLLQKGIGTISPPQKIRVYPSHDYLGKLIVTERKDIKELLENSEIDPVEISALMKGEHTDIPSILNRSLDVDRLDYLLRDSANTGLPYGRVDINYILNNLSITKNENQQEIIVLRKKARLSAEHLLLARYFMFNSVYSHKTVFGFEELVRKVISLLIERDQLYPNGDKIKSMIRSDSPEYLNFDDGYLDKKIDEFAVGDSDDILCKYCSAIKHRHPPKLVHEEADLQKGSEERANRYYTLFEQFLRDNLKNEARKFGIRSELLFSRKPKDVHFEALNPLVNLSRIKNVEEEELRELVKIIDFESKTESCEGKVTNLIEDSNSIIHYISQLQPKSIRLYAVGVCEDKLQRFRQAINDHIQAS